MGVCCRQTGRSEFKLADRAFSQRKDSSNPTYPEQNSRAPAKSPRRVAFGAQIVIYIVIYMYNLQFATTCPELEAIILVSSNLHSLGGFQYLKGL